MDNPTPPPPTSPAPAATSPEAMRRAMADYIAAVHRAYLDAAVDLPPAERARLPLVAAGDFTVAAVGSRNLHVIGTTDPLPPPAGQEVELDGVEGDLRWRVRFFDPVVVPELGLVDDSAPDAAARVRALLGLSNIVYHLTVPPGGGLTGHHALHVGTGLAHSHASASRDYDTLLHLLPSQADLLREMRAAETAQLAASVLLLARTIAPHDDELGAFTLGGTACDVIRRRLLAAVREAR